MSQIGTLLTGAGVTTVITGQAQCESVIVLGDVDTANALRGLQVEIDGTPYINIQTLGLMNAFCKWMGQTINGAAIIGNCIKIATGRIARSTTYRFTNDAALTPAIFAFSDNDTGIPILAATKGITASSFEDFDKFSALFIEAPGNVSSVEVVFRNGTKATMTIIEIDTLFAMKNQSETNGKLAVASVIDNQDQSIRSVRINASVAVTILVVKIPDQAFGVLKEVAEG